MTRTNDFPSTQTGSAEMLPSSAKALALFRRKIDMNENAQWQFLGTKSLTHRKEKQEFHGMPLALIPLHIQIIFFRVGMLTMQRVLSKTFLLSIGFVAFAQSSMAAQNRFTQLIFTFPNQRGFAQTYNKVDNALTLEFQNTSPNELGALDYYDETIIKRILVKDLSPRGTEVRIVLKDRNLRAAISEQQEPFRVVVDLFDKDFEQPRDPETGLPLVGSPTGAPASDIANLDDVVPNTSDVTPAKKEESAPSRRLLQPQPPLVSSPVEMRDALNGVESGIGKKWRDYPLYIYRLQTASYIGSKEKLESNPGQIDKAMSSTQAMADFAGRLYDFGHENRALLAYQQVLYKDPKTFEENALHLWKFAESHLGQGNLTLADGYYQSLIEKHPQSELSEFAKLRRLDIQALNAVADLDNKKFKDLVNGLAAINDRKNGELKAQIKIRQAYWTAYADSKESSVLTQNNFIPAVDQTTENELKTLAKNSEGQRTGFLAYTIAMNAMLAPTRAWGKDTGTLASEYFQRFSGSATEPFRDLLKDKFVDRFSANAKSRLDAGLYVPLIEEFEELTANLQDMVLNRSAVAWAMAESYRNAGMSEKSSRLYDMAAKKSENKSDQFRANFWLAVTAADTRQKLKTSSQNPARVALLGDLSRAADTNMERIWNDLDEKARKEISTGMQIPLEKTLDSEVALKTPALVVLGTFSERLSTKIDAGNAATPGSSDASPLGQSVYTLAKLAKRFNELAMPKQRQDALALLKNIKPANIKGEDEAKKVWAKELLGLAEEYRTQDNILEAGRLYAFTGTNGEDYAQRAESLYKGGLLLYRAGRREEALTAFKSCSEDGNNRYYANLCLERLDKLNNQ